MCGASKELTAILKKLRGFITAVKGCCRPWTLSVVLDGGGPKRREWFVLEVHNNMFSCVAATGKAALRRRSHEEETKIAEADGWSAEEEINGEAQ